MKFKHCLFKREYMLPKPKHMTMIAVLFLFTFLSNFAYGHGMSEAERQAIVEGGNFKYLSIGATHMLGGYDHLMFVFGIIFFLTGFRDIVKYVSAFTLGHSVTLIFATYNGIQMNYFLIDAVIALSVCYIAFANLDGFRKYLAIEPPNMMVMIIGLGLIHGFGLSTRLQELPLNVNSLLLNIISFNVGIELGQITALAFMLLLISAWRKAASFLSFSVIANFALIMAGLYLFLMQMHGYTHTSNAEEFVVRSELSQKEGGDKLVSKVEDSKSSQQTQWKNSTAIIIPARGDKEHKLNLEKGALLEYSWETNGEKLFFDFHGEPKGDTTGYFKSYKKNTDSQSNGSLTTPFEGTHGWYWKNDTNSPVTVQLKTTSSYQDLNSIQELEQTRGTQSPIDTTHGDI